MKNIIQLLTDPENQPHQFVGDPDALERALAAPLESPVENAHLIAAIDGVLAEKSKEINYVEKIAKIDECNVHIDEAAAFMHKALTFIVCNFDELKALYRLAPYLPQIRTLLSERKPVDLSGLKKPLPERPDSQEFMVNMKWLENTEEAETHNAAIDAAQNHINGGKE